MKSRKTIGVILFDKFEVLDVFGPVEMFGMLPDDFEVCMVAENSGEVASAQGPRIVAERNFSESSQYDILLVPGGAGTRRAVENNALLEWLRNQANNAQYVTSVCTGSAILAKAGLLDGKRATTNKMNFEWISAQGPNVIWVKQARWVEDGNTFTSAGVSAGMDMALGLIEKIIDGETADRIASWAEYDRHACDWDPFAKIHGLV